MSHFYFTTYVYFEKEFKRNFRIETENEGVTKINDCAYLFKKGVEVFLSANLLLERNYSFFFFLEIKLSFCLFKVLEKNATIFLKILP